METDSKQQPHAADNPPDATETAKEEDILNETIDESVEVEEDESDTSTEATAEKNPLHKPPQRVPIVFIAPNWKRTGYEDDWIHKHRNPAYFDAEEAEMTFWHKTVPQDVKAKMASTQEAPLLKFKATEKAAEKGGYTWKMLIGNKSKDFLDWLQSNKAPTKPNWLELIDARKKIETKKREERKEKKKTEAKNLDAREKQQTRTSIEEDIQELGISSINLEEVDAMEEYEQSAGLSGERQGVVVPRITVRLIPRMGENKKLMIPPYAEILEAIDAHPTLSKTLAKDKLLDTVTKIKGADCPTYSIEKELNEEESKQLPRELIIRGTSYPVELKGSKVKLLEFAAKTTLKLEQLQRYIEGLVKADGKTEVVDQLRMTNLNDQTPTTRYLAWITGKVIPRSLILYTIHRKTLDATSNLPIPIEAAIVCKNCGMRHHVSECSLTKEDTGKHKQLIQEQKKNDEKQAKKLKEKRLKKQKEIEQKTALQPQKEQPKEGEATKNPPNTYRDAAATGLSDGNKPTDTTSGNAAATTPAPPAKAPQTTKNKSGKQNNNKKKEREPPKQKGKQQGSNSSTNDRQSTTNKQSTSST